MLYSYVVTHDTGFALNPFWGFCTVANCKPVIRRTARQGDWIVGLTRKKHGNRIVYAMEVSESRSYAEYFRGNRFSAKKPDYSTGEVIHKCGDNIYEPLGDCTFRQLRSMHSNGDEEDLELKAIDLSGENVLIAERFYYFGSNSLELPDDLDALKVMRGHRSVSIPPEVRERFVEFISGKKQGVNAPPYKWPDGDKSWRQA